MEDIWRMYEVDTAIRVDSGRLKLALGKVSARKLLTPRKPRVRHLAAQAEAEETRRHYILTDAPPDVLQAIEGGERDRITFKLHSLLAVSSKGVNLPQGLVGSIGKNGGGKKTHITSKSKPESKKAIANAPKTVRHVTAKQGKATLATKEEASKVFKAKPTSPPVVSKARPINMIHHRGRGSLRGLLRL
jgi:hypothetical protein